MSTTPQTTSEQDSQTAGSADSISDPATLHTYFCEACNAGELYRLLNQYEPDAVIVEPTGELTRGTGAIREHLAKLLAMQPEMQILGSRTVIAGELAQLSSHWRCDAVAPDGSAVQLEYHGSELARRQLDGSWRIVIDNPWGAASTID